MKIIKHLLNYQGKVVFFAKYKAQKNIAHFAKWRVWVRFFFIRLKDSNFVTLISILIQDTWLGYTFIKFSG